MNESADFVMYWWDHAAELLTRKGTVLRRFGLVTTNSITQVFQRRVVERTSRAAADLARHGDPGSPLDKGDAGRGGRAHRHDGRRGRKARRYPARSHRARLDTDQPLIALDERVGSSTRI